jgi:hypothetical protein
MRVIQPEPLLANESKQSPSVPLPEHLRGTEPLQTPIPGTPNHAVAA